MKSAVVLISGRGSNLQALLDAQLPVAFRCVISNVNDAGGLEIARRHQVATSVIEHRQHAGRAAFDAALAAEIDRHQPDFIILAGFMRIFTDAFVRRYQGRMVNIHPSLLPAFTGLDTHARALAAGVKIHGCTVHFVTPELDVGPIIVQAAVPVLADDTPERLAARVLAQEHRIYPQAIRWLAEERLQVGADGIVRVAGVPGRNTALLSPWEAS